MILCSTLYSLLAMSMFTTRRDSQETQRRRPTGVIVGDRERQEVKETFAKARGTFSGGYLRLHYASMLDFAISSLDFNACNPLRIREICRRQPPGNTICDREGQVDNKNFAQALDIFCG